MTHHIAKCLRITILLALGLLTAACTVPSPQATAVLPKLVSPTAEIGTPTIVRATPTMPPPTPTTAKATLPPPTPTLPSPTVVAAPNQIAIEAPQVGDAVTAPAQVRGTVSVTPAGGQLLYRVYDTGGNQVGNGMLPVQGQSGQPGAFAGEVAFSVAGQSGPGRIEVLDRNPVDGSMAAVAVVDVYLGMDRSPETRPRPQILAARQIVITAPQPYVTVDNPFEIQGTVKVSPFEGTLVYMVYDAEGYPIGTGPIQVQAEMGQPGPFVGTIRYLKGTTGAGRIEVLERSAADGFVLGSASLEVIFGGQ
jgi:Immunoglobulin-like domain of bacterial spore germination